MAFQGLPNNNCENQNTLSGLGEQHPLNELEENIAGVSQPPSPMELVREYMDDSNSQNFEAFSSDVQIEQVRGMETNFNQQQGQASRVVAVQMPERSMSHRMHRVPVPSSVFPHQIRVSFEQVRGMERNFNPQQGYFPTVVRWQAIQVPGSQLGRPDSHCVHWIPDPLGIPHHWIPHQWVPYQNPIYRPIYRPLPILPIFFESALVQPPIIPSLSFSSDSREVQPSFFSTPLTPDIRPIQYSLDDIKDLWEYFDSEDVNNELSQEEASISSKDEVDKKENDGKDEAHLTAQTTECNLGNQSSEDNSMAVNPEMDESSDSLELDTIMEEVDGSELSVQPEKFDSPQLVSPSNNEETEEKSQSHLNENSPHEKQDAGTEEKEEGQKEPTAPSVLTEEVVGDVLEMEEAEPNPEENEEARLLAISGDYIFEENNPKKQEKDPYYEGLRSLCEGDLINSVLGFEAALSRRSPACYEQHFLAWGLLGVSQAANEQDILAIIALRKFLSYHYHNLHAIMFITICYWYESYKNFATLSLWKWLFKHPTYFHVVDHFPPPNASKVSTVLNLDFHQEVVNFYLRVINEHGFEEVDYNVHAALGLLYNMVGDFSRAVECFDAAAQAEPRDEIMWSLLGEAHINNRSYDQAFPALYRALSLRARYARVRYNLGTAFSKTGNQKEAMINFVKALSIQSKSSRGFTGSLNEKMWKSAKATIQLLGRTDLKKAVDNRDIASLEKAFEIEQGWLEKEEVSAKKSVYRFFKYIREN